jgi:hypothetical protein
LLVNTNISHNCDQGWELGYTRVDAIHFSLVSLSLVSQGGVRLSPLGTSATIWPIVPVPDDDECGAVGGMRISRGNLSTRRNPATVSLCPLQIPHELA